MNKIYLCGILAMAAVASTSCSNEETRVNEPKSDAIEFGTYLGRDAESRASVFTTDNMKTDGFAVFASYTGQSDFADQTMNFMYNQQVTYNVSAWTYAPLKYWPNNPGDKVSFFAYAPHNVLGAEPTADKAQVTFTVQDLVANQKDLVVADALKDQTKQAITGNVNFTFRHVFARVGLNVEAMFDLVNSDVTGTTPDSNTGNGSKATETTINVTKVELIGKFDKDGVIDLTNSTWSGVAAASEDVKYTWEAANFDTAVADNVTTTKQQLNKADHYAMIIPQNVTGMQVRVTYTVTTNDDNLSDDKSAITNVITSEAFPFTFEQGKAYMFNLHLGMTSVKFNASVSDWNTDSNTVVNLPINFN